MSDRGENPRKWKKSMKVEKIKESGENQRKRGKSKEMKKIKESSMSRAYVAQRYHITVQDKLNNMGHIFTYNDSFL